VEKGRVAERVPGREKTGIQFLRPWLRDWTHSLCSSRRELGIHCSWPNLDSGIFRVVQYRSSTRASDREKARMTVFTAVYKERRNRLIQAFFTLPLFFFVYSAATCCAAGATSSGRSPGRSVDTFLRTQEKKATMHSERVSLQTSLSQRLYLCAHAV